QIKLVNHRDDAVDAHLQTETIEVTVARMDDRGLDVGSAVVAHAARELIADLNSATADEVRVLERDCALLETGDRHRDLPGRTRRITALNRTVQQRRL